MSSTHFIKVLDHSKLSIYAEKQSSPIIYNPKNENDIKQLCKDASLLEFIKDKNPKYPALYIFKSSHYNRGVITDVDIKKNQTICEYLGEIGSLDKATTPSGAKLSLLKQKKIKKNTSSNKLKALVDHEIKHITHYAFGIKERSHINDSILAHNKRSIAGFINHNATDPNVKSSIIKNIIYYKAARDIQKGEQLIIDYGPDYDYPENLYYIPSYETHLSPGVFLAEHISDYYKKPIPLTRKQKDVLQITDSYIILPHVLHKLPASNISDINKLKMRLPLYTFERLMDNTVYIPQNQFNITALMFACTLKNADLITRLIKRFKIDVFAKTSHDLDALTIAVKSSHSEEELLSFAKPLIKKVVAHLDRIDSIGSDHFTQSALHILVDREWCKAIRFFNNPLFFSVIDTEGYDPFISAIAHGKTRSLAAMLKLKCMKKLLYELLFAEDETQNDYVLRRALINIPEDKVEDCLTVLLKAIKNRPTIKKKLMKFIEDGSSRIHLTI